MESQSHQPRLAANHALRRYGEVRELIANPENPTPLLRLSRVPPNAQFEIHLKLEWFNPFGSIKDRTALWLLKGMLARGELDGKDLVEPSSGNTGIALAALAVLLGKKLTVTIPDGVPEEKKVILRMLGAEVWATPDDLCPINHPKDGAIALARSFLENTSTRDRYAMPNQYENADNVRAHYETTGPEIWRQTEGQVDVFVAGYGTCGTITGAGRYLKERKPGLRVVAVEPQKGHRLPGLKNLEEAKTPGILDRSVIDEVIRVNDAPAYSMTKRLFREEGLIVGPSTGAMVDAAVRYGQDRAGLAVVISPDSGFKYSTFFADTLGEEGLPKV
jgi:cysteine synthase A/cysteine synthase B